MRVSVRAVGALAAAFAASVALGLTMAQADSPKLPSEQDGMPTGITADGRTYGSELDAQYGAPLPDLIGVIGDTGVKGYIDQKAEAKVWDEIDRLGPGEVSGTSRAVLGGEIKLPVYDTDGSTVIDHYTLGSAKPGIIDNSRDKAE